MVDLFQVNCEEIALEQGKTIKEIAEELGVSKTAVRKQIANLELQTSLRKIGNQFAIEKEQEALIKSAFFQKQSQTKIANQVSDFANQSQTKFPISRTNRKPVCDWFPCSNMNSKLKTKNLKSRISKLKN